MITIYERYIKTLFKIKESIPDIEYDLRILKETNSKWFLLIPIAVKSSSKNPEGNIIALDPGVKTFQVGYSEKEIVEFDIGKEKFQKIEKRISDYQRVLVGAKAKQRHRISKKINKMYCKLKDYIKDCHYKVIKYLTSNYKIILLPAFETSDMIKKSKGRWFHRTINSLRHYQFQCRLVNKCKGLKDSRVIIVTEEYTSKTCGKCGSLNNNLTCSDRTFQCKKCNLKIDRDINGARNILLKFLYS